MQKHYHSKGIQVIEEFVQKNPEQIFCAAQIRDYLKQSGKKIDNATIYRSLDRMVSDKRLISFRPDDEDCVFYQYVEEHSECHEHFHVRCRKCGKVIHLEDPFAEAFIDEIEKKYGFKVCTEASSISGLCESCR